LKSAIRVEREIEREREREGEGEGERDNKHPDKQNSRASVTPVRTMRVSSTVARPWRSATMKRERDRTEGETERETDRERERETERERRQTIGQT
jgi:hypothetical protein